ncbi:MAG: cation-translocating P-type ATPase [Eubacteriaceae bacterium]|nr:cation-translocating P-type ATPase [Eubacteriaceae bacterium]
MNFFLESVADAIAWLNTSEAGLTQEEAARRLAENGRNELDKAKGKSLALRLIEQIINPMVLILLVAAAVSIALAIYENGSVQEFAEAGIIMTVVIINSILGVVQESKAEKAIEALQQMTASTAKVRRGVSLEQIPAAELVLGDIVLLEAGDTVPADLRLTLSASLRIEEAALTGESVPVDKLVSKLSPVEGDRVPLGDRKNMAYMSSGVVYGRGEGVVCAVGMATEMGKIASIIQSTEENQTPLQKRLDQLSKILTILVLGVCAIVFAVQLTRALELNAEVAIHSFMLAISLAVAAIPEGLVAVVTIVLSIGVTNMAKRRAIIRRLTAVETLGCAQVICSDKTGTLTQNKMTVMEYYGDAELLARGMALCCDSELAPDGQVIGDPTENALIVFAQEHGFNKNELDREFPREAEAPFDSMRKMMSTIHKTTRGYIQFTKGAPEEVLDVCTHAILGGKRIELDGSSRGKILDQNREYADKALRVLACAYRDWDSVPKNTGFANIEREMTFVGLEAMIDPVRVEVKAAIESCDSSGIKVVMITGDHKETAVAIAKEIGIIADASQAMTGSELDELGDAQFEERVSNTFVYARVQPEHKVRIVEMWKKKGFITAMTGDGVNDAPAIKSGDIGVGMGITGTDVTKNVADMVLADDNFATIVVAVEEGRRIYDNIKKTIQFLLGSNLAEVISIFVATLMGFVLFKPVHLLFINLVTDSLPAVALGMEEAEPDIMDRPPRNPNAGIFAEGLGFDVVYQGILVTILTLASYFIVDNWDIHEVAMTSAFLTMSMCEIFHAYNMRSQRKSIFSLQTRNTLLWVTMGIALALTLLVIYVPALETLFSLEALTLRELVVALGLSITIIPLVEIVKAIQHKVETKPV